MPPERPPESIQPHRAERLKGKPHIDLPNPPNLPKPDTPNHPIPLNLDHICTRMTRVRSSMRVRVWQGSDTIRYITA